MLLHPEHKHTRTHLEHFHSSAPQPKSCWCCKSPLQMQYFLLMTLFAWLMSCATATFSKGYDPHLSVVIFNPPALNLPLAHLCKRRPMIEPCRCHPMADPCRCHPVTDTIHARSITKYSNIDSKATIKNAQSAQNGRSMVQAFREARPTGPTRRT